MSYPPASLRWITPPPRRRPTQRFWAGVCLAAFTAFAMYSCTTDGWHPAYAHGADDQFAEWFMSLKQPDFPDASCCGPADQVYVDSYEPSRDPQNHGGFRALVKGAWIEIPAKKVILDRVNPTGRGVLFIAALEALSGDSVPQGYVFCFIPGSGT